VIAAALFLVGEYQITILFYSHPSKAAEITYEKISKHLYLFAHDFCIFNSILNKSLFTGSESGICVLAVKVVHGTWFRMGSVKVTEKCKKAWGLIP